MQGMAKGHIFNDNVPGLVKSTKTGTDQFENKWNFLKAMDMPILQGSKEFAIEVDVRLNSHLFEKKQGGNYKLFAIDIDIAKSLLSSADGKKSFRGTKRKKGLCWRLRKK